MQKFLPLKMNPETRDSILGTRIYIIYVKMIIIKIYNQQN